LFAEAIWLAPLPDYATADVVSASHQTAYQQARCGTGTNHLMHAGSFEAALAAVRRRQGVHFVQVDA
jgi:hypothetical protein